MGIFKFRETLMKAFPVPDLHHIVAFSTANPCALDIEQTDHQLWKKEWLEAVNRKEYR